MSVVSSASQPKAPKEMRQSTTLSERKILGQEFMSAD
jgi:hypothetical protein